MQFYKRASLFLTFSLFIVSSFAQTPKWFDVITFTNSIEKITDDTYNIVISGKLADGWHIYSTKHDPAKADGTGVATVAEFTKNENYKLIGKLVDASKVTTHTDELGISLYLEGKAVFKQKIQILNAAKFDVNFKYYGQVCDENGCLFIPDQKAKLNIDARKAKLSAVNKLENVDSSKNGDSIKAMEEVKITSVLKNSDKPKKLIQKRAAKSTGSLWKLFFFGFLGGLTALFTPCLFPMIPMTVTFFLKQKRVYFNAAIYGLAIIAVYVLIGILASLFFNGASLNQLASNQWMNIFFFAIFIFFAFSFLGAYEITLPNSWVNKADAKADQGGILGPIFMAFVLVLVSFSCTGPIVGTLLIEASSGGIKAPIVGMAGFSLALALPFTLFAIFPKMLNSLPQSGGWLNSVKVVLGLLEIALALKFLSAADLAYHWDFLTREIFIAVWVVIFFSIGFYLLGKLKFSHDSEVKHISVPRFMFALVSLVFAIYLFPGMWGAPLKAIDGIAPPLHHSEDNFAFSRGQTTAKGFVFDNEHFKNFKPFMHEINGGTIHVFHDLKKGEEYAKLLNLPILLDFTGHSCANCRKTESSVWTNPEILSSLQNELVVVSLYCDDRTELPASEKRYSKILRGDLENVGNKWSEYEIERYGASQQPLYVIRDAEGNDLNVPIGYTSNIQEYKAFLKKGIEAFEK